MEPGIRSDRSGMCLMRRWEFNQVLGYRAIEILDPETKHLVGAENYRKIDIETRKSINKTKRNEKYIFH